MANSCPEQCLATPAWILAAISVHFVTKFGPFPHQSGGAPDETSVFLQTNSTVYRSESVACTMSDIKNQPFGIHRSCAEFSCQRAPSQ